MTAEADDTAAPSAERLGGRTFVAAVRQSADRSRFLIRRVANFDRRRVWGFATQAAESAGIPRWRIALDMIRCAVRHETTFNNYCEWDFPLLTSRERRTFMTDPLSFRLSRRFNDPADRDIFDDKLLFARHFDAELGRAWLDVTISDVEDLDDFLRRSDRVITKDPRGVGGVGITIRRTDAISAALLHDELRATGETLVEEVIDQHPDLARMYPGGVNSLRMVTFLDPNDRVHVLAAVLKIGNGGFTDNFSNGGMYTMLDEHGIALHPAADEAGHVYETHPQTGVRIQGFQVPQYAEALRLVDLLARRVPTMPYIGWDIAITLRGPVVIEGNHNTGVFQSKPSISGRRQGLLARYRAAMNF